MKVIRNLLFLILPVVVQAQPGFFAKLENEKNDSLKCELIPDAVEYYKYHSVDTLMILSDMLLNYAEKLQSVRFKESGFLIRSLGLKLKGDFNLAIESSQQALDLNKLTGNNISRAKILLNYADLLRMQKQFDLCEQYHREGIRIARSVKDSSLLARYYINTGLMFMDKTEYDSAGMYYNLGIAITDKNKTLTNIGITARLNLSALASKQKNYEEMIRLSEEVYQYSLVANDADHISLGANNAAMGYLKLANYEKALEYIGYAEVAARKYNSPQNLLYALGNASDIHAEKGDYKSAYEKALAYIGLKDSLRTALYDKNLTEITTKYELEEKENLLSQHQITIQEQNSRQRLILWISSILLLSVMLLFFILKSRQELKRKTAEIEAEKANLTAQLEHAEVERLQELDEMRSNFFANISHEFRTPLTLILNPAEQLLKENIKPEQNKYFNIIHRNASRLLALVNQLLDLSKLESGKAKLKVAYYDLKIFCKAIGGLFESLATQKEIDFIIDLPEEEIKGYFDKDVMEKIIVNLLSNAFKFTPNEGRIQLKLQKSSQQLVSISVSDTGKGISENNLEKLFDRFMSFSGSDVQSSSGLGLSFVRELSKLHKGEIKVESELGIGTVFTFSFCPDKTGYSTDEIIQDNPVEISVNSVENGSPIASKTSEHKKLPDFNTDKKPLLLLAEDNPDVRLLITDICKNKYEILSAENGKLALQMAIEKIPDMIITDVMMPEMDGKELCAALRNHDLTNHIPIIMLTARGDQKDKLSGLKTGADDYLTKPFDDEELLVRLDNLLVQRKNLQEYYKKVLHAFTPQEVDAVGMDTLFLQNLKDAIEQNLHDENYGVSELAGNLALSRSQLHRKVTSLLGHAPNEIIRNMRLEKARMLIRKKSGTISEIAYQCGFNSPAYFAKCYKDYFGHTALEE
ncbi:MAG: response regulator [Saprospiraceae bacterium]|nr:response regulator [Saprospiraceae bacterium]